MLKSCCKCGVENATMNNYCFKCGNKEFVSPVFCQCGTPIEQYYKFCPVCGYDADLIREVNKPS